MQNFNPIGLKRKLEIENERQYIKLMWDICLPHVFTRFIYLKDNFTILSSPNLTYQKAKNIAKRFTEKDTKNIDVWRAKIQIIHYIYRLLYPQIYNRVNNFGIQNKTQFEFIFSNWKAKKHTGMISPKIVNELATPTKQTLITDSLFLPKPAKNPRDYKKRDDVKEFEQKPISDMSQLVPMNPELLAATVSTIKTEILQQAPKRGTAKEQMDLKAAKRWAKPKISLERQLSKNTMKMNMIKNPKMQ